MARLFENDNDFIRYETHRIINEAQQPPAKDGITITPQINSALEELKSILLGGQNPQQVMGGQPQMQQQMMPQQGQKKPNFLKQGIKTLATVGGGIGGAMIGGLVPGGAGAMMGGMIGGMAGRKLAGSRLLNSTEKQQLFNRLLEENPNYYGQNAPNPYISMQDGGYVAQGIAADGQSTGIGGFNSYADAQAGWERANQDFRDAHIQSRLNPATPNAMDVERPFWGNDQVANRNVDNITKIREPILDRRGRQIGQNEFFRGTFNGQTIECPNGDFRAPVRNIVQMEQLFGNTIDPNRMPTHIVCPNTHEVATKLYLSDGKVAYISTDGQAFQSPEEAFQRSGLDFAARNAAPVQLPELNDLPSVENAAQLEAQGGIVEQPQPQVHQQAVQGVPLTADNIGHIDYGKEQYGPQEGTAAHFRDLDAQSVQPTQPLSPWQQTGQNIAQAGRTVAGAVTTGARAAFGAVGTALAAVPVGGWIAIGAIAAGLLGYGIAKKIKSAKNKKQQQQMIVQATTQAINNIGMWQQKGVMPYHAFATLDNMSAQHPQLKQLVNYIDKEVKNPSQLPQGDQSSIQLSKPEEQKLDSVVQKMKKVADGKESKASAGLKGKPSSAKELARESTILKQLREAIDIMQALNAVEDALDDDKPINKQAVKHMLKWANRNMPEDQFVINFLKSLVSKIDDGGKYGS